MHLCATKLDNFFFFQTMKKKKKIDNPSFQSARLRDCFFFVTSAKCSETRVQFTDSVCHILPFPPTYATTKVYRGIPSICKVFDDEYRRRRNPSKNNIKRWLQNASVWPRCVQGNWRRLQKSGEICFAEWIPNDRYGSFLWVSANGEDREWDLYCYINRLV